MRVIPLAFGYLLAGLSIASAATTSFDVGGWAELFRPIVSTVVETVVGGIASWLMIRWGGKAIEEKHRNALQTALRNAAGLLVTKGFELTAGKHIDISNPALAAAIKYAQDAVPQALDYFNLKDNARLIAEKIVAQLPQVTPIVVTPPVVVPAPSPAKK